MDIKWKVFKQSFPHICTKCGSLSNMIREFCETCGAKDSLRATAKGDWEKEKKSKFNFLSKNK
jgi:predicted  nucleic acid-binding Zn-ribbon protein